MHNDNTRYCRMLKKFWHIGVKKDSTLLNLVLKNKRPTRFGVRVNHFMHNIWTIIGGEEAGV